MNVTESKERTNKQTNKRTNDHTNGRRERRKLYTPQHKCRGYKKWFRAYHPTACTSPGSLVREPLHIIHKICCNLCFPFKTIQTIWICLFFFGWIRVGQGPTALEVDGWGFDIITLDYPF